MNIVPDLPEQIKSGKRAFSRRKQYLNGSHYTQFPRVGTPKWLLFAKVLYRKLQATLLYLGPNVWKFAWIFLKPVKSLVVSKFIMKRQQALYQQWIMQNEPAIKELNLQQNHQFKIQPSISIVVPVFNAPPDFLVELFESVLNQT
ncbi:MAG: hypothetical protein HYY56_02750, partial [Candidatus Omnitrophica bacterium]|nr:hypothetical protein [Candidatus Omnitrophota bacterium]